MKTTRQPTKLTMHGCSVHYKKILNSWIFFYLFSVRMMCVAVCITINSVSNQPFWRFIFESSYWHSCSSNNKFAPNLVWIFTDFLVYGAWNYLVWVKEDLRSSWFGAWGSFQYSQSIPFLFSLNHDVIIRLVDKI